ncbi:Serine/threonine-protein phosphatase 2A activator 2 [Nowakowskiella sp. JEL0078]|nr:Serine/threonine-protein phosphatase 2A activator 2 [Nowakowskiella sp. JEL0078]
MLDDISGVKLWSKINSGMIKMFKGEVLNKLPIMQHFLFGSMLQFEASDPYSLAQASDDCCGHSHHVTTSIDGGVLIPVDLENVYAFGQQSPMCCGIKIPSAIGAAGEFPGRNGPTPLRKPLPFD